jgi:Holliday junction resolvasome RuvABC endonuclease subunit
VETFHIGFDQAFRNAGWAVLKRDDTDGKTEFVESGAFRSSIKMGYASDAITYLEHAKFVKELFSRVKKMGNLVSIGIEDVALGAVGQASARGGVFGVYSLHAVRCADLIVVSPKKLKSYWTDSGSAEKEELGAVIIPKYGLESVFEDKYKGKNAEDRKRMWDEVDAIGIAEVGMMAWRALNVGFDSVKDELSPNQKRILWSDEIVVKKCKTAPPKHFGICKRINDFYIKKR